MHRPNDSNFHECLAKGSKSGAYHTHGALPLRHEPVSLLPRLRGELRPLIDLLHLGSLVKLGKLTFGNTLLYHHSEMIANKEVLRLIYTTLCTLLPSCLNGVFLYPPRHCLGGRYTCSTGVVGVRSTCCRLVIDIPISLRSFSTRFKSCMNLKDSFHVGCPSINRDDRGEPETPMFTPYARHL